MDPGITLETALKLGGAAIIAIAAFGIAATGLVDASKVLPFGGISRTGFAFIGITIQRLTPPVESLNGTELSLENILRTLSSQWIGGTSISEQVYIAKSLVSLRLVPETAAALAKATGIDATILREAAERLKDGAPLDPQSAQANAYARFDLLLTTMLDQAYQRASQRRRTTEMAMAVMVSVGLACWVANQSQIVPWYVAFFIGLISVPIATAAMQALQFWKK